MTRISTIASAFCLALVSLLSNQPSYTQGKPGVERLYILNCGEGIAGDISRWSPGVNIGKSMDFVDNCYHELPRRNDDFLQRTSGPVLFFSHDPVGMSEALRRVSPPS